MNQALYFFKYPLAMNPAKNVICRARLLQPLRAPTRSARKITMTDAMTVLQ
jgi:hypothetical protein